MKREAKSAAWADPEVSRVLELISESSQVGWREALGKLEADAPFFAERMRNVSLSNWRFLLHEPGERVLDVGCGFGSLTLGAAASADVAVGMDVLVERLRYGNLRARQERCERAHFLAASGLDTPFASEAFDMVVYNGVLEWAGLFAAGDVGDLQRAMLREAGRLLRPGGSVAVTIENALAAETLLALPDTHTGTHFLTSLPEPASSYLLKLRLGEEPRVRLHSRAGYRALLRQSGFSTVRVLNLIPSYNNYRFAVDVDDAASHRFIYRHLDAGDFYRPAAILRRRLAGLLPAWIGRLGYAYLVLGGMRRMDLLLDSGSSVWSRLGVDEDLKRFGVQLPSPGGIGILLHDGERPRLLLKSWSRAVDEPALPATVGVESERLQECGFYEDGALFRLYEFA